MKIKLDENIPWDLAEALDGFGHDTHSVMSEGLLGSQDPRLLTICTSEQRVFVTQDIDFARTRHWLIPAGGFGLVVLRLDNPSRRVLIAKIMDVMQDAGLEPLSGRLTIVSTTKIRQRQLGTIPVEDD